MTTAVNSDNSAKLTYKISFTAGPDLEGSFESVSGSAVVGYSHYEGKPEGGNGPLKDQYMHEKDPEKQTINLLANAIYARLGCQNNGQYLPAIMAQITGGSISLYSDKGPCHSCRPIIRKFLADYPMLSFQVRYRKTDGWGKPIPALAPAGGNLVGAYGYEDAVEVNGFWCKVLA
ncbi:MULTISPECIES: deaminase domain-containing protein [unclassified Streptomyces]|uniref:deaminase domain-containing protein n=1 Tax=unclassified Streptomyces TaxID=2593676 RepID=UPI002E30C785|nr:MULTISPECIES: deaminase domain-containing protein [unclassified Streptomyces]WUC68464.1 hypothetical protein OG861_31880 [Streptomyces sp. NBC_00539]